MRRYRRPQISLVSFRCFPPATTAAMARQQPWRPLCRRGGRSQLCSDCESGCGIFRAVTKSHAGSLCPSSEVGIVTTRIHDARFPDLKNGWPLRSFTRELLSMGPVSRRLFGRSFDYPDSYFAGRNAAYVGAVHGSMLMVDTEKFLEAGGYDEGVFLYEEEQILGRRMQTAGYRSVLY